MGVILFFLDAEITNLLKAWSAGDPAALDELSKQVYDELRRMARRHMKGERRDNTLQTNALVHEVYLRLVDVTKVEWRHRAQFFWWTHRVRAPRTNAAAAQCV